MNYIKKRYLSFMTYKMKNSGESMIKKLDKLQYKNNKSTTANIVNDTKKLQSEYKKVIEDSIATQKITLNSTNKYDIDSMNSLDINSLNDCRLFYSFIINLSYIYLSSNDLNNVLYRAIFKGFTILETSFLFFLLILILY